MKTSVRIGVGAAFLILGLYQGANGQEPIRRAATWVHNLEVRTAYGYTVHRDRVIAHNASHPTYPHLGPNVYYYIDKFGYDQIRKHQIDFDVFRAAILATPPENWTAKPDDSLSSRITVGNHWFSVRIGAPQPDRNRETHAFPLRATTRVRWIGVAIKPEASNVRFQFDLDVTGAIVKPGKGSLSAIGDEIRASGLPFDVGGEATITVRGQTFRAQVQPPRPLYPSTRYFYWLAPVLLEEVVHRPPELAFNVRYFLNQIPERPDDIIRAIQDSSPEIWEQHPDETLSSTIEINGTPYLITIHPRRELDQPIDRFRYESKVSIERAPGP